MSTLANKFRPKRFADVVGQEREVEVLKTILLKSWIPPALLFQGPFGCGKTSLARLTARALFCKHRQGFEPCNRCEDCQAMDRDNHSAYTEIDASSHGQVADIREVKDTISYRVAGGSLHILYLDESHMLSVAAQNALLQTLEEGQSGTMFMFATTESQKVLPTIRSRCVELNLRTLTVTEIAGRLKAVCQEEKVEADEKALRILGTYARGHVRDALILLEQIVKMSGKVTEEATRTYLRLDRYAEVYELLTLTDRKKILNRVEELLCTYATTDLLDIIGQVLVNAYKLNAGVDNFAQVDKAWLEKINQRWGDKTIQKAEKVLTAHSDISTINYGIAVVVNTVFGEEEGKSGEENVTQVRTGGWRKPGK